MGLFTNYNDSGSGVSKKAPQKKMFFRFCDAFVNKFWMLIELNLIYVLFCLPVVTFGPATAALTSMMRNIYLEKPQFIFHDFWQAFKKNFKQSFVIGIVDIAIIGLTIFTFMFFTTSIDMEDDYWFYFALAMAAQVIFQLINFYIYPQIVALNLNMPSIIKNSVILAFVNIKGNLIALAVVIAYALLTMFFPIVMLVVSAVFPFAFMALVDTYCCYPAIQKLIINPFYEANGERNPELPDYEEDADDALFEDKGGEETPIKMKKERSRGGKNIR